MARAIPAYAGHDTKRRLKIEEKIVKRVIRDMLAAGFKISVHDGEEIVLQPSTDAEVIAAAMFSTDDDRLICTKDDVRGFVQFIYGNDGVDVINDYSISLGGVMQRIARWIEAEGAAWLE
jgi:hypothetical protein